MSCWALIPVKAPGMGKTRLASALDPDEREALVSGMLRHVLDTLRGCRAIQRVCVLGPARPNLGSGVLRFDDPGPDLNGALESTVSAITAAGPERILVLPADLPCITAADIERLVDLPHDALGIAPDRHRTGTNALSLPLPAGIWFPFSFGQDSFSTHCEQAINRGLTVETILSCGLEKDIDDPLDLVDAVRVLRRVYNPAIDGWPRPGGRKRPG
ncbi:2-phospho-L-lactate guanylyltransferase [Novosphingobium sp. KA1]|uniref:2-phospho-L-lactate guanylyltransferase n=1 Tax=Novosphingobium sp. (strain KA1) TaxID=164608 RepID=UPI001A8E65C5|nr:2-phospho-L-lactate guanylyltransferase [Novosphingobium sp. KA1]QSR18860.1 2-phospho-L-lactate guanylyltransferase [Novosphingobium sp. KA1]